MRINTFLGCQDRPQVINLKLSKCVGLAPVWSVWPQVFQKFTYSHIQLFQRTGRRRKLCMGWERHYIMKISNSALESVLGILGGNVPERRRPGSGFDFSPHARDSQKGNLISSAANGSAPSVARLALRICNQRSNFPLPFLPTITTPALATTNAQSALHRPQQISFA